MSPHPREGPITAALDPQGTTYLSPPPSPPLCTSPSCCGSRLLHPPLSMLSPLAPSWTTFVPHRPPPTFCEAPMVPADGNKSLPPEAHLLPP